jgi:hypothetical protein
MSWQALKERAAMLVHSGFLPQAINTPEKAVAIAMTGKELGIGMMESFRSINVILGKPTVSPQLMLALANRTDQLEDIDIDASKTRCVVTIKRKGRKPHTEVFGIPEATALGLMTKDNYTRQPATMFKWRALAANLRVTFPDVILGLYTPEEIGAEVIVTENEEMTVVPQAEAPKSLEVVPAEVSKPSWPSPAETEPIGGDNQTVVVQINGVQKFKNRNNDKFNYKIMDSEGTLYRTFSETFATMAKEASEQGYLCKIVYKVTKYGAEVVLLELAEGDLKEKVS